MEQAPKPQQPTERESKFEPIHPDSRLLNMTVDKLRRAINILERMDKNTTKEVLQQIIDEVEKIRAQRQQLHK